VARLKQPDRFNQPGGEPVSSGNYPDEGQPEKLLGIIQNRNELLAAISLKLNQALTEATLINSITKAASGEYNLHEMLNRAFQQLGKVINFTGGSIALVEEDVLVIRAAVGPFAGQALGEKLPRKDGKGRSWQVILTGEPFFSNHLSRINARTTSPIESFIAIPLKWQDQVFGLLEIDAKEPEAFKPEDLEILQKVGQALSGPIQLAIRYAAEKEALKQAQEAKVRLAFLSEASALLSASLDYEATLQQVVNLAIPRLADWCAIDLPDKNGGVTQVALAARDTEKIQQAEELRQRYPPIQGVPSGLLQVLETGQPFCIFEITDDMLVQSARDSEHLELLRKFHLRSMILVPLNARGRTLGVLTLANTRPQLLYGPADLEMAQELAGRAAMALDNALLYQEAQKAIRTRDDFLSIAAHELKTPVTSLRGYTQLLQRQFRKEAMLDPAQVSLQRKLDIIELQSQKMSKLIGRLLDISRLEASKLTLERQATNLVGLVEQALSNLQTGASLHTLNLDVKLAPAESRSITAMVDPLRIEQVVVNLLDNAVKFSPEGGEIRVEIGLSVIDASTMVRVSVTDQGVGIPVEQRDHIFDRFYQAHSEGHLGGMGLGLYISHQIVELHGGQLVAEFPDGGGTCFVFTLPVE
jgi:signal transduction histidine kinase/putative methionine-R-sulfoxide reductase with GAF domain